MSGQRRTLRVGTWLSLPYSPRALAYALLLTALAVASIAGALLAG
jgi:iron complex transport system permease protein